MHPNCRKNTGPRLKCSIHSTARKIYYTNSLQNNKISDESEFKLLADNKTNLTEKLEFILGRVEKVLGKGENAGF